MRGIRWGFNVSPQPWHIERYATGEWAAFATLGRLFVCAFGGRS